MMSAKRCRVMSSDVASLISSKVIALGTAAADRKLTYSSAILLCVVLSLLAECLDRKSEGL